MIDFMEENHRRPSKFVDAERGLRNWWKHQQKLFNAGELKPERVSMSLEEIEAAMKVVKGA